MSHSPFFERIIHDSQNYANSPKTCSSKPSNAQLFDMKRIDTLRLRSQDSHKQLELLQNNSRYLSFRLSQHRNIETKVKSLFQKQMPDAVKSKIINVLQNIHILSL